MSATSVRLKKDTERLLERTTTRLKKSRSAIIDEAVRDYCARKLDEGPSPYERIKHLIGSVALEPTDRSVDTGKKFREGLVAKKKARDPR